MTTNRKRKHWVTIILILGSFLAAHLCFWLLPNLFEIWNSQAIDQFFVLRSSSERLRLPYDRTVAHVDLNNSSIRRLKDLYLNRSHFAQATRNLSAMHVSAQVYDFIFAARLDAKTDRALIEATRQAGNVYFGLAFELWEGRHLEKIREKEEEQMPHLERTKWDLRVDGDVGSFYVGREPLCTFSELTSVSRGLGSMSIKFDRDGVLRRVPLILSYSGGFYPILPFRVVCDYLQVPPENVLVKPGRSIILKDARRPSQKDPRDIMIPIDHQGNMIVNYIGPWGQMDHYSFADILLASNDRIELEMWRDELKGKIVVISDVSTGSTDVGPVPTDSNFPLSGVHANVIHGILTESFLRELSHTKGLLIEVLILATIFFLSVRFTSIYFLLSMPLVIGFYLGSVSLGFFYGHLVFPVVRPILMVFFAVVSVVVYRYINEEKEKMASLRQRDFVRETFGRYLSNEVVEELLESPGGLEMGGENREVFISVSSINTVFSSSS